MKMLITQSAYQFLARINRGLTAEMKFLWKLVAGSKNWNSIPKRDLVIFDATSLNTFVLAPSSHHFGVVHVRDEPDEVLHVAPKVMALTLFYLPQFFSITRAYRAALVHSFEAKLVLTTIDNNVFFHNLSSKFPSVKFVAIQNGMRDWRRAIGSVAPRQFNSHLFCFGQYDVDSLNSIGITFKSIQAIGSAKFAYWESSSLDQAEPTVESLPEYDLCIVSQFRHVSNTQKQASWPNLISFMDDISTFLIDNQGLHVSVALAYSDRNLMSRDALKAEEAFYQDYLGSIPDLIPNNLQGTGAYELTRISAVNTSFWSTASFEAAAAGKRTVVHRPHDQRDQPPQMRAPWVLIEASPEAFHSMLHAVLNMSDQDFMAKYGDSVNYFMEKSSLDVVDAVVTARDN